MRKPLAALVLAGLFVGACAEDGSEPAAVSSTTSTTSPAGTPAAPLAPPTSRAGVTPTTESVRLPCRTPRRQSGPTYQVSARDNLFDPRCMALTLDQGLDVVNAGEVVHNFTLQQVASGGGGTELIDFGTFEPGQNTATEAFGNEGPGAGIFRLYCKIHEAAGMEAFLEVT